MVSIFVFQIGTYENNYTINFSKMINETLLKFLYEYVCTWKVWKSFMFDAGNDSIPKPTNFEPV